MILSLEFAIVGDLSAEINYYYLYLSWLFYWFWQANSGPNTNGCQVNILFDMFMFGQTISSDILFSHAKSNCRNNVDAKAKKMVT